MTQELFDNPHLTNFCNNIIVNFCQEGTTYLLVMGLAADAAVPAPTVASYHYVCGVSSLEAQYYAQTS